MQRRVYLKRLLTPAKTREGIKHKHEKVGLTLEMESLLVHSDGECAVILVIYADHSSLGEQRWKEGGVRETWGQSVRETRHTPLSIPYPLHTYLQSQQALFS